MTNFSSLLSAASKVPEQLKKLGKAEMADTVLNVTQVAYDLMSENLSLKQEKIDLENKIKVLDDQYRVKLLREKLEFHHDCYWDEQGRPVCSACLDKNENPAVIKMNTDGRTDGYAKCPICSNYSWSKGKTNYY